MLDQILSAASLGWAILAFFAVMLFYSGANLGRINYTLASLQTTVKTMKDQCDLRLPVCSSHMDGIQTALQGRIHDEAQDTRSTLTKLGDKTEANIVLLHGKIDRVEHRVTRLEGSNYKTPIPPID